MSSGRQTALMLVLAIIAAQVFLSKRYQAVWAAIWHTPYGIGSVWSAKDTTSTQSTAAPAPTTQTL